MANNGEHIITALDFDQLEDAKDLVRQLPAGLLFKVGLQAYIKFGRQIIDYLKENNKKLFLDLKFKDIPNTVYGAVSSCAPYTPDLLTIHLSGGAAMIQQAVEAGAKIPGLTILGVTVLTSMSDTDLSDIGVGFSTEGTVLKLVELGINNGLNAFVCSPLEIAPIRKRFGNDVILVTPGIRPLWAAKGDQKRVFTPAMAMEAGSNYLVIGRPISKNENPAEAFDKILSELQ